MPTGLTSEQVAERVRKGQVNRAPRNTVAEYADIVFRNLFSLLNALVVPPAIALFVVQKYAAGVAVSGMAITNTLLGLLQEIRAKWHLEHLAILTESKARLLPDRQFQ